MSLLEVRLNSTLNSVLIHRNLVSASFSTKIEFGLIFVNNIIYASVSKFYKPNYVDFIIIYIHQR